MAVNLTNFYLHVVADVVNNVRADFIHEGIDETVLTELQSLWELNMMQSGAIQGPLGGETMYSRNDVSAHVHDLNVPYGGETPTADLIFAQTPVHTPSSASQVPFSHFMGPGPSPSDHPEPFEVATGRPSEYAHASAWGNHKLEVGLDMNSKIDMNIAYDGGDGEHSLNAEYRGPQELLLSSTGKRKREDITTNFQSGEYFPQIDGAADVSPLVVEKVSTNLKDLSYSKAKKNSRKDGNQCSCSTQVKINCDVAQALVNSCHNPGCSIPQLDGIGDHYDDSVAEEDYNEPGEEGEEHFSLHEATKPEGVDPDMLEPPLNEDDDLADDLDDIDQTEGDSKTENLVLAQFEKVTRSKNKWKCILKDGIMRLQNQDYLFSRANGEFEF